VGANPSLNLGIRWVVVLGRPSDLDTKGLHGLRPKLRGKARVLVKDNAKREPMDIEDSAVEFFLKIFSEGAAFWRGMRCV